MFLVKSTVGNKNARMMHLEALYMLLHPGIQTIESSRQYLSMIFDGQRSAAIHFWFVAWTMLKEYCIVVDTFLSQR